MIPQHDPDVCSINPDTACGQCRAAWARQASASPLRTNQAGPGEAESLGDYRLFLNKLGLRRLPCQLDPEARSHLLQQLLDLERTVRYYPDWGRSVVTVLRNLLEMYE